MPTKDMDDGPVAGYSQTGEVALDKKVSEHRRKIIKASAAVVPAIMTIRSGAAAAMTSINHCEERDAARAALLPKSEYVVDAKDEWVRMEALCVEVGNNPSITIYGVPDNGVVPGSRTNYTVWYDEYGATTSSTPPIKDYNELVKKKEFDAGKVCYLLCSVDATSGVFTWYPQQPVTILDQSASAITASCLCSVNPDFTMG